MFSIRFEEQAVREMDLLRAFERVRILEEVEAHLSREPLKESRRKKVLHGLVPPWDQAGPLWQLRVGDLRVFYDVDEPNRTVIVRAIRRKPPHRTTKEIL